MSCKRLIKPQNDAGLKFVRIDTTNKKRNTKFIVECQFCKRELSIWATSYYQNKNTCTCMCKDYNKKLYKTYWNMRTRCCNQKSNRYEHYMGKGIRICQEWMDNYMSFQEWALSHGYVDGLTIDRIDNDGDYCPENCRWVDEYEQANNKSNNVMFVVNGFKSSLKHICNCFDLNYKTVTSYYYDHQKDKNRLIKYLINKIKNVTIEDFDYEKDYSRELLPII